MMIKWKSGKLEHINDQLLVYKLEAIAMDTHMADAKENAGRSVHIDHPVVLDQQKYYASLVYNKEL